MTHPLFSHSEGARCVPRASIVRGGWNEKFAYFLDRGCGLVRCESDAYRRQRRLRALGREWLSFLSLLHGPVVSLSAPSPMPPRDLPLSLIRRLARHQAESLPQMFQSRYLRAVDRPSFPQG
jgi:hypothetical protein